MSGISSASLVDLKAELFRKQEEFKKQKLLNASTNYIKGKTTEKKPTIFSRKNAGVAARAQKDLVAKTEEENLLEKSRRALQAKEKLYDQITKDSGIPDEDGSQRFLVDFQKKAIDKIQEQQRKKEKEEEEKEEEENEDEFVDSSSNPDEKWVEYTDSLGRTRTCMKKDLERMQKRDKEMGLLPTSQKKDEETKESSVGNSSSSSKVPGTLSSQEIYCQMLKDKWNEEEEKTQAKPVGPVHYENVRFDEIRTHGVGYYQFSKDEMERKEQMDLLNSIRDQTKDERVKRNQLKEKRDNLMAARLKKIKDRQRAKLGLPPEPEIEDEPSPEPIIENIPKEVKPDVAKKPAPIREWDLGKDKLWESEKRYFKEKREERDSKFAPPSFYYSSNVPSAPKRRDYQERQYSPPPEKKPVPQKLKKDKIKQQQQEKKLKEKKITYPEIIPDLSTIPLPGESIPNKTMTTEDQDDEKLTNNNNSIAESQTDTSSNITVAFTNNITTPQMCSQPAVMTAQQYNAMYAAAFSNQQQNIYPGNTTTPIVYPYTQAPSSDSIVIQQAVEPEKPKPCTIVDRRFVKNEETLQEL